MTAAVSTVPVRSAASIVAVSKFTMANLRRVGLCNRCGLHIPMSQETAAGCSLRDSTCSARIGGNLNRPGFAGGSRS